MTSPRTYADQSMRAGHCPVTHLLELDCPGVEREIKGIARSTNDLGRVPVLSSGVGVRLRP